MQYKVMTFNIQHGIDYLRSKAKRAELHRQMETMSPEALNEFKAKMLQRTEDPTMIDLQLMADVIKKEDPILCALNEMRDISPIDDPCFGPQAAILSEMTGLPYHYFGKAIDLGERGPYGNAFISKYPIISAETIAIPDPEVKDEDAYYESRCLIKAKLALPEGKVLTLMVTHMGLAKAEARNAVACVLENLPENEPALAMGDFNLTPDSEILQPLNEKMQSATDLLPEGTCTFPSDGPNIKIDHIYAHGPIRLVSAAVPEAVASDHRPHTAIIEV